MPLCFFLIFLLLFSAFNSVEYALLVFTGVPLALTGGILSLWLRDMPFRSPPPSVLLPCRRGRAQRAGDGHLYQPAPPARSYTGRAILQGAMTRLRPVLMTALVASLGFVPMAIATGTGAEVQKPLATVVIGGLIPAPADAGGAAGLVRHLRQDARPSGGTSGRHYPRNPRWKPVRSRNRYRPEATGKNE